MRIRKILMPTDFSPLSTAPLELAESLARQYGATLVIAHVEEPAHVYLTCEPFRDLPDPNPDAIEQLLKKIVPRHSDVPVEHRMLKGLPSRAINDCARDEKIDLIVIGTHGRSGMQRFLIGSVAEAVVRDAPCPVFVFKTRPEELSGSDAAGAANQGRPHPDAPSSSHE